jgi:hypothetical protein
MPWMSQPQVQLLQLAQVHGLQVQLFVSVDMAFSSREVMGLRLTRRKYRSSLRRS